MWIFCLVSIMACHRDFHLFISVPVRLSDVLSGRVDKHFVGFVPILWPLARPASSGDSNVSHFWRDVSILDLGHSQDHFVCKADGIYSVIAQTQGDAPDRKVFVTENENVFR